jgi:hypothetical protein
MTKMDNLRSLESREHCFETMHYPGLGVAARSKAGLVRRKEKRKGGKERS